MSQPRTFTKSWWWCARCHAYRDLDDPGEPFPRCSRCGSHKIQLRRPEPSDQTMADARANHRTDAALAHRWFDQMREVVDHAKEAQP